MGLEHRGKIPPRGSISAAGSLMLSDTTIRLRPRDLGWLYVVTRSPKQGFP